MVSWELYKSVFCIQFAGKIASDDSRRTNPRDLCIPGSRSFETSAIRKKMMIRVGTPLFCWSGCQMAIFFLSFLKPTWIFKTFIYLAALGLSWGMWDLHCGAQTSVVVAWGLHCPAVCGISVPQPGTELCPLHLKANSLLLDHQESPKTCK